ncbi:MAG TPA: hypothetical protein VJB02_05205 [Coxiellaceae bacterium]|nr:hypothetical protein [Coxiellaceae bacterium]
MSRSQCFNYLAICILEELGILNPTQLEIDCVERAVRHAFRRTHQAKRISP